MTNPSSDSLAIEIEGLVYRYGESGFRLDIPRLHVARGSTLACIGPSGCGKTTFLHLLAGILLPEAGRVVVEGVEWSRRSEAERRAFRIAEVGLVFQQFALLDHLSVRENVLLPYYVNPALTLDGAVEDRLHDLARATEIEGLLGRRPRDLSQGERQRTAICRALVTAPRLVLADEPTGNLDPATTGRVLELLLAQTREQETTLLMVTHDHGLVDVFDDVLDFATLHAPSAHAPATGGAA